MTAVRRSITGSDQAGALRAYLVRPLAALHLLAVQVVLSASARLATDLTRQALSPAFQATIPHSL